ncbi:MAG: acyl-ACP--UDP-N-acetylglucosamine O-acyltransferase [Pseudomonadota bacterium]|nr:acyl-ACP--UDP-N-acetylglucosamine O-acyltransferase [Pseudomonadota bacterium]
MIDAHATIHPHARLAEDVEVGPYTMIGADVEIGPGTWIGPHVVINGPTRIGRDNQVHAFAALGGAPQDKGYQGDPTRLEIGDRNVIREYCSMSRGTVKGGGLTRVGDDNWFMAYAHVAHDCRIGNHTVFINNATLAGHIEVGDHTILSGFTAVYQFCTIGAHVFSAGGSLIHKDVPPYLLVSGQFARPIGINATGLKRRGFSSATILQLKRAFKILYHSSLPLDQALEQLRPLAAGTPEVGEMVAFIEGSSRGVIR